MTTETNIYIADLAAYNAGILHGVWVDATLDLNEIQEQIDVLLKNSPEEIAIYDYEGFEGVSISEYEGLESVHKKALFIQEHGKLGAAVLDNFNDDFDEAEKSMEENYQGEYESIADYAQELTEETSEVPKHLAFYIDYESMAKDMELNSDIFTIELGYREVHVFWNN